MGYFAKIENGVVQDIIRIENDVLGEDALSFPETENKGQEFIADVLQLPGEWKQTSYSGSFRKRYASIGFIYDSERDEFVSPYWELVDGEWQPPVVEEEVV